MEQSGESGTVGGRHSSRRVWTHNEESALINALKDIIVAGMRSEQGFKPGHLSMLERSLVSYLPGTDLCARPHIESKLGTWRRQFNALFPLVSGTGNVWNSETHVIDISDEAWDAICKKQRTLKQLKRKYVPWLGEWLEVFGRDRADGGISENLHQAYNAVTGRSTTHETADGDSSSHATNEEINTSILQGKGKEKVVGESSGKKRKCSDSANDIDKEFMGMMSNMSSELVEGFQNIAKGMGLGFDVAKARNDVYEVLNEFESLKLQEKVYVGCRLARDAGMLQYFFSLPSEGRLELVKYMLDDDSRK